MSTKRRRILDEDDSDLDVESKKPSLTTTTSSSGNTTTSDNKSTLNDHNDDDEKAKNTVMRMLRNTKKSNVKVQLNKSTLPLPDPDPDAKKLDSGSIPRKASAQIPTTIPKRGRDEIPKKSKATDDNDPNSTLLSLSMLPMPSSTVTQSQMLKPQISSLSGLSTAPTPVTGTTAAAAPSRSNATSPPPPISAAAAPPPPPPSASGTTMATKDSMTTTRRPKLPTTTTRPPESRLDQQSQLRMDFIDTGVPSGQAPSSQHQPHQLPSSNAPPPPPARLKDEEKRVLNTLKTLCSKVNVKLQPSDDLLSGSFAREPATAVTELDQGEERRIPIFPEDFTQGQPLWPLSWWGIVDPVLNTTNNEDTTTILATSAAGGTAEQRHNTTARAIQKVMDKTKQLVEGTISTNNNRETDATPSGTATTTGQEEYHNTDRLPHRDHHHHSDRRSRGDRSDHDRRRHDDSDRRRRHSRHDRDGGDSDGRRLDGDDRGADGPPPYSWDHPNPPSDRRMGHPLNPPPGVSGSPPRDPGHPRRGPPPRY